MYYVSVPTQSTLIFSTKSAGNKETRHSHVGLPYTLVAMKGATINHTSHFAAVIIGCYLAIRI